VSSTLIHKFSWLQPVADPKKNRTICTYTFGEDLTTVPPCLDYSTLNLAPGKIEGSSTRRTWHRCTRCRSQLPTRFLLTPNKQFNLHLGHILVSPPLIPYPSDTEIHYGNVDLYAVTTFTFEKSSLWLTLPFRESFRKLSISDLKCFSQRTRIYKETPCFIHADSQTSLDFNRSRIR
jgi:hypothetical protein